VLNALFPLLDRDREATQAHLRDRQEPAGVLMTETIQHRRHRHRGDAQGVKHVHLSVHPPGPRHAGRADRHAAGGRPRLRHLQARLDSGPAGKAARQARETPRQFVERESHYLWGRRYLLTVSRRTRSPPFARPSAHHAERAPRQHAAKREEVMHEWHKALLHETCPR
jgi:hypothetical protein